MYKALDVANYIICYSNEKGCPVNNIRLQGLLYFTQAAFLAFGFGSLFEEELFASHIGPMVQVVWEKYLKYDVYTNLFCIKTESIFNKEETKLINDIIDAFSSCEDLDLINLAINHRPWINAMSHGEGTIISKEALAEYFSLEN